MTSAKQRIITTNGLNLSLTEQGQGPLVSLCHGFPETSAACRHQLPALAEAGFRAAAPDLRGYGLSDRPADATQHSAMDILGDLVGLLDALGEWHAMVVGSDWGATIAWQAAIAASRSPADTTPGAQARWFVPSCRDARPAQRQRERGGALPRQQRRAKADGETPSTRHARGSGKEAKPLRGRPPRQRAPLYLTDLHCRPSAPA